MELDEIVDKYRGAKPQLRYALVVAISLLPAVKMWFDQGEALELRKAQVETEFKDESRKFEVSRQRAAELPALEAKLSEIEGELAKAKEFLPDKIEIDAILSFIGTLEKELDVKVMKFTPLKEEAGQNGLEYREWPVELVMHGTFTNTMRFMDRLVHMQNLTHMRNINFNAPELTEDESQRNTEGSQSGRKIDSSAKLILFKGV